MATLVKQFRYYSDTAENKNLNLPANWKTSGIVFQNYGKIKQIGIQTLPGTVFTLDGAEIMVGFTGIFELTLNEQIQPSSIIFNSESLGLIAANKNTYLIIDILYEAEEGGN